MKVSTFILAMAVPILFASGPVFSDWDVGEPHKMHFPQLPDPAGWDIEIFTSQHEVADDWQCAQTGQVNDIHFWVSWQGDQIGTIDTITATIYDNIPDPQPGNPGTFSMPGAGKWSHTFGAADFAVSDPVDVSPLLQGFADPQQGPAAGWGPDDHRFYLQINIENIRNVVEPFVQQEGEIYWLGLYADWLTGIQAPVGWKTSLDHFEDVAVYRNGGWLPLFEQGTGPGLDMAFVITPEPASLALMGMAGLLLLSCRSRGRRKGNPGEQ